MGYQWWVLKSGRRFYVPDEDVFGSVNVEMECRDGWWQGGNGIAKVCRDGRLLRQLGPIRDQRNVALYGSKCATWPISNCGVQNKFHSTYHHIHTSNIYHTISSHNSIGAGRYHDCRRNRPMRQHRGGGAQNTAQPIPISIAHDCASNTRPLGYSFTFTSRPNVNPWPSWSLIIVMDQPSHGKCRRGRTEHGI